MWWRISCPAICPPDLSVTPPPPPPPPTPQTIFDVWSPTLVCRRAWGPFCKRNLNLHPIKTSGPLALWQTECGPSHHRAWFYTLMITSSYFSWGNTLHCIQAAAAIMLNYIVKWFNESFPAPSRIGCEHSYTSSGYCWLSAGTWFLTQKTPSLLTEFCWTNLISGSCIRLNRPLACARQGKHYYSLRLAGLK